MTTTRFTNPVRDPVDPDREQEIAERKGDRLRQDDVERQLETKEQNETVQRLQTL
jgi:hypothetical protein